MSQIKIERKAGVLMHISSLPGRYAAGDFGYEAYRFADFLNSSGQSYWQVLPLNQLSESHGYSPYSSISAFAGNTWFISPEILIEQDLLNAQHYRIREPASRKVNYKLAGKIKEKIIDNAFNSYKRSSSAYLKENFTAFRKAEKYWLKDYACFKTLKTKHNQSGWNKWPIGYRNHDRKALELFSEKFSAEIEREEFAQFLFQQQWKKLKHYCNEKGIKIFGDIPIYINYDSADVWAHPEIFKLDKNNEILALTGVPPDYFSKSGQLWSMPVYRWAEMKKDGFNWWKKRIRKNIALFDLLRLDHFRGFSAFWEVPAGESTAVNGKWVRGPGTTLFNELKKEFPDMPFVAEDLGQIDESVCRLRDKYGLPGMRVLQFAFGKDFENSTHIPHNHIFNSIVYTGTHDNNTLMGWFMEETGKVHRKNLKNYLGKKINRTNCTAELIRLAYSSVAKLVIIPLQDIIGLESEARMNTPSVTNGNWVWRLGKDDLEPGSANKLRKLAETFGRTN